MSIGLQDHLIEDSYPCPYPKKLFFILFKFNTRKGTTTQASIFKLEAKFHPVIKFIIEYLHVLIKAFIGKLSNIINHNLDKHIYYNKMTRKTKDIFK